ncbi:MAG: protein-disulfide reductase DsbD domain-containing protein, partial [candidate division FCPU426 bacterium]
MLRLIFALLLAFASFAEAAPQPVKASLVAEKTGFTPGSSITVGLRLKLQSHWHSYWRDPGTGLATEATWTLPAGVSAGPIQWPKPKTFKEPGGLVGYGYEGDNLLLVTLHIPASYTQKTLPLKAALTWLACREVCIPGSADVSLTLKNQAAPGPSAEAPLFALARSTLGQDPDGYKPSAPEPAAPALWSMLLLAFLGGLILNLMPCVLPVLSLKVMAFIRQSGESRKRVLALGASFTLGTLSLFWVLAALVVSLKAAGENVGWGFQFQNPLFVGFMALVVTGFAMNLFGVFELGLPGAAAQGLHEAGGREGLPGAFFTGAFMTLLATPCTAPFLGTALGFAFSQSGATLFAIFTAVGLGLATPYQLLSVFPKLMQWMPKPGKWMLHFKQLMGFFLMATLLWLLWVLGKQTGLEFVIWFLAFLLVLGLACWIYGAYAPLGSGLGRIFFVAFLNLLLMGAAYKYLLAQPVKELLNPGKADLSGWEDYTPARLAELKAQGKTVFLDFSAEWCWTCKVNEKATLNSASVRAEFEALKVAKLRADWTKRDKGISELIYSFGRSGVPLYVVYPGSNPEKPLVLPEVVTPKIV